MNLKLALLLILISANAFSDMSRFNERRYDATNGSEPRPEFEPDAELKVWMQANLGGGGGDNSSSDNTFSGDNEFSKSLTRNGVPVLTTGDYDLIIPRSEKSKLQRDKLPLLETVGVNPVFAFDSRGLRNESRRTYKVRRSSDNATRDFSYSGLVDGSCEEWVGAGNDGFVAKIYGLTGNYLEQTTDVNQRKIVDAGSLVKLGDYSALGSESFGYDFGSPVTLAGDFCIVVVAEIAFTESILGGTSGNPRLRVESSEKIELLNDSGAEREFINFDNSPTSHAFSGQKQILVLNRKGDRVEARVAGQTATSAGDLSGTFTFRRAFARNSNLQPMQGKVHTLLIYDQDMSSHVDAIERNLCTQYSEQIDLFYAVGQSNMQGRDVDGTNNTNRDNDASIFEYYISHGVERNPFTSLYPSGGSINDFSLGVGLMRSLHAANRTKNCFIRCAFGGHGVAAFLPEKARELNPQTNLSGSNVDRSSQTVNFLNDSAVDLLKRHFQSERKSYFLWFQGAEDAKFVGNGAYDQDLSGLYGNHLTKVINYFRANILTLDHDDLVIIVQSPDWNANTPNSKVGQDTVRAAQAAYAAENDNVELITTDAPNGQGATWEDASHLDAATQENIGIDVSALIL